MARGKRDIEKTSASSKKPKTSSETRDRSSETTDRSSEIPDRSSKTPNRRLYEIGELQQAILEVLWTRGEATVEEVRQALKRPNPSAYTTILSLLQKLERNGWVTHRNRGRSYVYSPTATAATERTRSLGAFVDRLFGGDPMRLFEHLLEDPRVSETEIAEIKKLIRRKRERDRR